MTIFKGYSQEIRHQLEPIEQMEQFKIADHLHSSILLFQNLIHDLAHGSCHRTRYQENYSS